VVVKLRAVAAAVLLGLASVTLITGCSRERIDWKSAEAADTQEGYNHFLERHPDSELATQARARLAQLAEDKDWQRAIAADTADAYRSFLAQHATGKWAEEARIRMENFTLDSNAAPASSTTPGEQPSPMRAQVATPGEAATAAHPATPARSDGPSTVAPSSKSGASPAPAASHSDSPTPARPATATRSAAAPIPGPPSKPAPVAPTKPEESPESSGYGIQLGAFSSQAAALNEWKRLQLKFDSQLHGMFARAIPVTVTSGTLFRLQSPTANESKAREICGELTKQQQPCVIVLPPSH
jgi:cell division septation protein DedD